MPKYTPSARLLAAILASGALAGALPRPRPPQIARSETACAMPGR